MTGVNKVRIFLIALVVIILDQVTKQWILSNFSRGEILEVVPGFFNLTLTFNPGMAFGLFASLDSFTRTLILSVAVLFALLMVFFFLFKEYRRDTWAQGALALVVGGALGNVIDRFRFGSVVDFLDFYYKGYHWPAFNVADSAICVAVVFLLFRQMCSPPAKEQSVQ